MSAGKAARAKGHRAELAVAAWFRSLGPYPDACTTRSKLGHDGSRQPGDVDVCDGTGLVVEVKVRADSRWPTFIAQAREQAQERPWVLVRKTHGVADPGRWIAAVPLQAFPFDAAPALVAHNSPHADPAKWLSLDPDRYPWWTPAAVVFCTLADAEALHRAAYREAS